MDEIKYIIKESDSGTIHLRLIGSVVKKRFGLFLATILLTLTVVFAYVMISKPYYDTKIAVGSSYFTGNAIEPMIIYLSDLLQNGNYAVLAQKLDVSEDKTRAIARIQMRNKSTQNNFFTADIVLRVYRPDVISPISDGILHFLNQNSFISNRVKIMKDELQDFTAKGERELARLDSVKQSFRKVLEKRGSISNNMIFPSNMHLEAVMINEKVSQARQNFTRRYFFQLNR